MEVAGGHVLEDFPLKKVLEFEAGGCGKPSEEWLGKGLCCESSSKSDDATPKAIVKGHPEDDDGSCKDFPSKNEIDSADDYTDDESRKRFHLYSDRIEQSLGYEVETVPGIIGRYRKIDIYNFRMANEALKFVMKLINCGELIKYVDEPVEAGVLLNATCCGFIYFITFELMKRSGPASSKSRGIQKQEGSVATGPETYQAQVLFGIRDEEPELIHFRIKPRIRERVDNSIYRFRIEAESCCGDIESNPEGSAYEYDEPWLDWPVLNECDTLNEFPNEERRQLHYLYFWRLRENMGYEFCGGAYDVNVSGGLVGISIYFNGMAMEALKFAVKQLNDGKLREFIDEEVDAGELLMANVVNFGYYITFTVIKKFGGTETCQATVLLAIQGSKHKLKHFRIKPMV